MDLSAIVVEATRNTDTDERSQKLLCYDHTNRRFVPPGAWNFLGASRSYYLVTNENDPLATVSGSIDFEIEDLEGGGTIALKARCNLSCVWGMEEDFVRNWVVRGETPNILLLRQLKGHGRRVFDEADSEALEGELSGVDRLLSRIGDSVKEAVRGTGANLRISVQFPLEPPEPLRFHETVSFSPSDVSTHTCSLDVRFALAPDPREPVLALRYRRSNDALMRDIRNALIQKLELRASMQQTVFETKALEPMCIEVVQTTAKRYGRTISGFKLACLDNFDDVERDLTIHHEFKLDIRSVRDGLTINSRVLLTLQNLGLFLNSGVTNLGDWTKERLRLEARSTLFDSDFDRLALGFVDEKSEIKSRVSKDASTIGYKIQQLHTISTLEVDELRKGVALELEDEFTTEVSTVKAGLRIQLEFHIPDPTKIADDLRARVVVVDKIKQTVIRTIASVFYNVNPEEFFLGFAARPYVPKGGVADEGPYARKAEETLERSLERIVRAQLRQEFGAEVRHIGFSVSDTKLTKLIAEIMSERRPIALEVVHTGHVVAPTLFEATMEVYSVAPEGWDNLIRTLPTLTLDGVVELTKQGIEARLREFEPATLKSVLTAELQSIINRWLDDKMGFAFGLAIRLFNLVRSDDPRVKVEREIQQRRLEEYRDEQLYKIETDGSGAKRLMDVQKELADETAQTLSEQIQSITKQLGSPRLRDKDREHLEERRRELQASLNSRETEASPSSTHALGGPIAPYAVPVRQPQKTLPLLGSERDEMSQHQQPASGGTREPAPWALQSLDRVHLWTAQSVTSVPPVSSTFEAVFEDLGPEHEATALAALRQNLPTADIVRIEAGSLRIEGTIGAGDEATVDAFPHAWLGTQPSVVQRRPVPEDSRRAAEDYVGPNGPLRRAHFIAMSPSDQRMALVEVALAGGFDSFEINRVSRYMFGAGSEPSPHLSRQTLAHEVVSKASRVGKLAELAEFVMRENTTVVAFLRPAFPDRGEAEMHHHG